MNRIRMAVVGAGQFGRNHLRVVRDCPRAELAAVVDIDPARAQQVSAEFGCASLRLEDLPGKVDAAVVATPTTAHAGIGVRLLEAGIHTLVEKPIAATPEEATRLTRAAEASRRVLQVGHLERFNPAILALDRRLTLPLFFEIHRLNVFSPRSLDVDVVLDLMIHDLDIVLAMTGKMPAEVQASGISILSGKVDIANVRLVFEGGCVANLTASRVSTERVRKLRLFQPHQYVSLDYTKQEAAVFSVGADRKIGFEMLRVDKQEPLKLQLDSFLDAIAAGGKPRVSGEDALRALVVSFDILAKIEKHARVVAKSISSGLW